MTRSTLWRLTKQTSVGSGGAARIRAQHRLRTPDALQVATAVHAGATGLITNDPALGRVEAFEMLVLDRIL